MRHKKQPTVSIALASFLRGDLLDLSLASILRNIPPFPIQIVVVNDGLENDNTKKVCDKYRRKLNIKYVFSGQRNTGGKPIARCPAPANNMAIVQSDGDIVVLTCAEILHLNNAIEQIVEPLLKNRNIMTIPDYMYFDQKDIYTQQIRDGKEGDLKTLLYHNDFVRVPFFMGIWKKQIMDIRGYDEDFIGYGTEDNDFVARLVRKGLEYERTGALVVHLYHGKSFPIQKNVLPDNPAWMYNRKLCDDRKNIIVRNVNRPWGVNTPQANKMLEGVEISPDTLLEPIPKILHLYWDDRPMSWLQTLTVTTFHKHNPDWEIRIYRPIQEDTCPTKYIVEYDGDDYFPNIENLPYVKMFPFDCEKYGISEKLHNILRSDIFRYYLLYDIGGVWSDFDVLWLRSIESLLKFKTVGQVETRYMGTYICKYELNTGHGNISVLISKPKHPLYKKLIDACLKMQDETEDTDKLLHQAFGTNLWDEIWETADDCIKEFPDVVAFPYKTFYPFSIFNLEELFSEVKVSQALQPEVACVHWFNGHHLAKDYINSKEYPDCSMTRIVSLIKKGIL